MYSSRGSDSYGQQSYSAQSSYGQNPSSLYPANSAGGPASSSHLTMGSRHQSILGGPHESEIGGYRAHPAAAQYGGQYGSLYGQSSLSAGQQGTSISVKGSGPSTTEGRTSYGSARADSPKYASKDYVATSSHGYGHKSELLIPDMAEYASLERRQFAERQGAYVGRDLPVEVGGRYADSVGYAHKSEMYDRLDQASILRQEQMLKSQSLQSASHEASRQADYLAVRSGTFRHPAQELVSYGGRLEADPRVSAVGNSSYGGQPAPSILGAAPQRNVDDPVYAQTSSNPGYGVSLPPGRDYGMGKGLHGTALESDFPGSLSSCSGLSRIDDIKDDRYSRVLDLREDERRREQLRDRERERDRDRERERERDREKERERKRLLEIREKERERDRDRERKRALESRRDRTPPRASKDRRGSSSAKDGKPLRRDSPRREALHRIHSPVREKRREYACKVYTSSLVDVERDYLSLDKRYPRLYISPDFSKVVVNWPRVNLKLPMHTPVSFGHDFVEDVSGAVQKELSTKHSDTAIPELKSTVWNAKMILMSGLSRSATEDLCSEKISDDRIPHICNLLKFAVLKKDRSLMAIGGPWDPVDGGDPSLDDSSLVHTILRYAKDLSHLDLQNCQHWNRFLEIHYDRVGKDGLFSHREVTVVFVPDLSDCLPSLNAWREQWLAHKKAVAEHEKQLSLGKEKSKDKRDPPKESSSPWDVKKAEKKKEVVNTGQAADVHKEKDGDLKKASTAEKDGDKNIKNAEKKEVDEPTGEANNVEKKGAGANTSAQKSLKPAKKKIVRKIIKQKVTDKIVTGESGGNDNSKLEDKAVEPTGTNSETAGQQDASPADVTVVKTFTRKKVAKKLSEADAAVKELDKESGLKSDKQPDSTEDKSEVKPNATGITVVRDGPVKRVVKRKIIKRVPKKKASVGVANSETSENKTIIQSQDGNMNSAGKLSDNVDEDKASEGGNLVKCASTTPLGIESSQKHDDTMLSSKVGKSADKVKGKEEEILDEMRVSETKSAPVKDIQADSKETSKGKAKEKERKEKDKKDEPRSKSSKDTDRKKSDEPPRHPGLILQTKSGRDTKLRSLSLSLDSLLDYSDNDVEEETFELSVFAESFYEMLQYQMSCRVLTFLQKLRIKFVTKRNSRKRERENAERKRKEKASTKRLKTEVIPTEEKSSKSQLKDESHSSDEKLMSEEDGKVLKGDKSEKNDEAEKETVEDDEEMIEEEDPEEDPEEDDEDMQDASPQKDSPKENIEPEKIDIEQNQKQGDEQDARKQTAEDDANFGEKKASGDAEASKPKEVTADVSKKISADKAPVDKELLQAFRFFDRNRVGYLRVEDLRLLIHNLGKFFSHRDVKELVQSALLESNTGRDDRILYEKLVRMSVDLDK